VPIDFPEDKLNKVVVDLMNEDDSAKFINDVTSKYGSVDAAVLTVGGFAMGSESRSDLAPGPAADVIVLTADTSGPDDDCLPIAATSSTRKTANVGTIRL